MSIQEQNAEFRAALLEGLEVTDGHRVRAAQVMVTRSAHGGMGHTYAWRHTCRVFTGGVVDEAPESVTATAYTDSYDTQPTEWCIHAHNITSDPAKWPRVPSIAHIIAFTETSGGGTNG